jgi:nucleotide-binding universal stress UspA family protein
MKTYKIKKVLIALDYNHTAKKVAETGYAMAKALGAEITLLHVISDPVYYASTEYSPIMGLTDSLGVDPLKFDGDDRLRKMSQFFLEDTKHYLGDETIKTMIEEGDFAGSILTAASSTQADVIVMGSHSRKWLENIVMGSVTQEVLQHSAIPLFIVQTKKRG